MEWTRWEEVQERLSLALRDATEEHWRLVRIHRERGRMMLDVALTSGTGDAPKKLTLEVQRAGPDVTAYRIRNGLAVGYRGRVLPDGAAVNLDRAVDAITNALSEAPTSVFEASSVSRVEPNASPFPTPWQRFELNRTVELPATTLSDFKANGHVEIRRALPPGLVNAARPLIFEALGRHWPTELPAPAERQDAYARAFTQLTDLWSYEPTLGAFGLCQRLASIAAQLLETRRVRLFCEDWLVKEPGAALTPWHQDAAVMPFDAARSLTLWVPLQNVGPDDGALRFAQGSHRLGRQPIEDISDTSEAEFEALIAQHALPVVTLGPLFIGDISAHHGFTVHGAHPNRSRDVRPALALHCFADGARFIAPTTPKMRRLLDHAAPDAVPGRPAASNRWPPLPRVEVSAAATAPIHLHGRIIGSDGVLTRARDLWIEEGLIRLSAGPGRRPSAHSTPTSGIVITSGLVEGHGHISYPTRAGQPASSPEWMRDRRRDYAATGVTLIRDMGALDDAICELLDVPGLPRVQASGLMLLPHARPPFTATSTDELVAACTTRLAAGASWIKVFTDWSTDFVGRRNSGFSGNDPVTYPLKHLRKAVALAHDGGARVGAHCFTTQGAEVAIMAGVDCLEHGWGLSEALLEMMARQGTAWAPLAAIAPLMWANAVKHGDTQRARWVETSMAGLSRLLPLAAQWKVPIIAGTDMFPSVTVADEISALASLGLDASHALAAGTWRARRWLREPGIEEGAPADLVLFASDPTADLSILHRPEHIFVGGVSVAVGEANIRPSYVSWHDRQELLRETPSQADT